MNYYLMREGATCYIWALRFNPQVLPYRRSNQYLMGKWAEKKQKATCLRKKAAFQRDECRELLQVTNAYMNISLLAFYVYISYVMVCFNDTIKSLHFETIACQSYKLQRHHRLYSILPLTKATRQPTHFYNSKGTVGGEWNLTQHIGRVEYNEHGHRAGGQTRSKTEVIVGPRPPLIQMSQYSRSKLGAKGGSRVSPKTSGTLGWENEV